MIEQIKDPATKRAISRKILEALHDWFEVDESMEKSFAITGGRRAVNTRLL